MTPRTQTEYSLAAYAARELYEQALLQSYAVTTSLRRDDEMLRYLKDAARQMGFALVKIEDAE